MRPVLAVLLTACAATAACRAAPPPRAPAEPPAFEIEYAGCRTVVQRESRLTCIVPEDGRLTLWAEEPVEIRGDGRLVTPSWSDVDGGRQYVVQVPPGARRLAVSDARSRRLLTLNLMRRLVERKLELRARYLGGQGRLAAATGRPESAVALALKAAQLWAANGRLREEVTEATFAADQYLRLRRFTDARRILDRLDLSAAAPAEATFLVLYHRGWLAQLTGDFRSAGSSLTAAARQAGHVGLMAEWVMAGELLGIGLQAVGRSREAADHFHSLDQESQALAPCELARLLNNQAWSLLLAGEEGEDSRRAEVWLTQAERIVVAMGCSGPTRFNLQLNLALAHLQAGRLTAGAADLRRADDFADSARPEERFWRIDLQARLALAGGRPEVALTLDRQLGDLAERLLSPDGRWHAAFGRGLALANLGRRNAALAALGEAEDLLDRQSRLVPVDEGRESFLGRYAAGTRRTLDLLLAEGRGEEAMTVARRSRSRVLRQLATADLLEHLSPERRADWERAVAGFQAEREALDQEAAGDWRLAADELALRQAQRARREGEVRQGFERAVAALAGGGKESPATFPPPQSGELLLVFHRLPEPDHWAGFAALGRKVATHRFVLPTSLLARSEELAARLLLPFRSQVERCQRLRVLLPTDLETVDFHTLLYSGEPLFAIRPVVYGLDLAPRQNPAPAVRRALVVADPQGDLPEALREGEEAREALATARPPWRVTFLAGQSVKRMELAQQLTAADLLHYAGHGNYAGRGGWESVLPLAGGSRLTLVDLLALARVPSRVVLSACDGGHPAASADGGLNLAEAFLLAGADSVLAATRPVGDRAARAFFARLYREEMSAPDLETALQRTQRAFAREAPDGDWRFFRLLVR